MKTFTFFLLFLLAISVLQAQEYQLSFSGSGQSTTIDSIQVQNLTQGTTLSLNGDDILYLVGTVGVNIQTASRSNAKIYPNPMVESTFVEFYNSKTELVNLEIFDEMGKLIANQYTLAQEGSQRFKISGLNRGIYTVNVSSVAWRFAAKLVSFGKTAGYAAIEHQGTNEGSSSENLIKSTKDIVQMQYNDGEWIFFKSFSGIYSNVLTLLPTQSQTVNFEFIPCLDGDENNYAVVTIGTQTWMAENLSTTKYNNGNDIPYVPDSATWSNLTSPGYCWYNNDQVTYGSTYGALYNWHTVNTANLCPSAWHVPTDVEWTTLTTYLESEAGGKLKETGLAHWISPNMGATNETGFTALPGSGRNGDSMFFDIGFDGAWWSSTSTVPGDAWGRVMHSNVDIVEVGEAEVESGFSVRCIKD